ncbi:MAG: VanW family protein [Candidatus Peribacteria bacterium]|nr:VanW family protein [Candidatus Peribacteria bacterium]
MAHYRIDQLTFYVSEKDISRLSRCNTQNYSLALQRIDNYLLKPGESFNANRELAKVKGYCTGRGGKDYLFYGGVCGMTAQVFRTTLIHPDIEIVKRHPHNEWFVQYYGEEIGGDDAAIYEMSKQFEIKNAGTEDIYFKVKWGEGSTQLVAVSPHNDQRVEITKHPINALNITLERTIRAEKSENEKLLPSLPFSGLPTEKTQELVKTETFPSTYIRKNYETR